MWVALAPHPISQQTGNAGCITVFEGFSAKSPGRVAKVAKAGIGVCGA